MTKKEIAKSIADRTNLPLSQVTEIVRSVFSGILDGLVTEGRVELRNFGIFQVEKRKARIARNPRTGETVLVPERLVVTFKPGREMAARIRELHQMPDQV